MTPHTTRERRSSSRFDKVFPVYVASEEGLCRGIARNISEGGMFIETRDPQRIGGQLTICFADERMGVEITALAEVRYQCVLEYGAPRGLGVAALRGMGLRFVEFFEEPVETVPRHAPVVAH